MKTIFKLLILTVAISCLFCLCSCFGDSTSVNNGGNNQNSVNGGMANGGANNEECVHSFGDWQVITAASCTAEGQQSRTCSKCDTVEKEKIAKLSHSFGEYTVTKEADCEKDGSRYHTCTACQFKETEVVKALGHEYQGAEYICKTCNVRRDGTKGLLFERQTTQFEGEYEGTWMVSIGTAVTEKHIVIPAEYQGIAVTAIREEGFAGHEIESVVIPASVKAIGQDAFKDCTSLSSVTIKEGTELGWLTGFRGCTALKTFTVTKGIRNISKGAFAGAGLTSVVFEAKSDWKKGSTPSHLSDADVGDIYQNAVHLSSVTSTFYYVWIGN